MTDQEVAYNVNLEKKVDLYEKALQTISHSWPLVTSSRIEKVENLAVGQERAALLHGAVAAARQALGLPLPEALEKRVRNRRKPPNGGQGPLGARSMTTSEGGGNGN